VSTSLGLGRRRPPLLALVPWARVFDYGALGEQAGRAMAEELYFGGYPPPPVEIPLGWFRGSVRLRQSSRFNRAEVTKLGGATARSSSVVGDERQRKFTATLDTIVDADPANLAKWVTDYYDEPMPRSAALVLVLNSRTQTEIWRILGVRQGRRISIVDTPAGWPSGATELIVEGITHQIVGDARTVTWNTSPVIGAEPGTSGPWARFDETRYSSSTEIMPF
jgi:hypothetical protein